jgi:acyl carrier protein
MSSSVATVADRTIDHEVVEVVRALAAELGSEPAGGVLSLDQALDRDLGLGSLERVELALRLEHALGVALGDEVMQAVSVADLVRAAHTAGARSAEALPVAAPAVAAGTAAPLSARTLTEVLAWHADRDPDRVHVLLAEDDGRERAITYGELWRGASAIAAALGQRGPVRGASVAIMLRRPRSSRRSSACSSPAAFRCRSIRRSAWTSSRSTRAARSASSAMPRRAGS